MGASFSSVSGCTAVARPKCLKTFIRACPSASALPATTSSTPCAPAIGLGAIAEGVASASDAIPAVLKAEGVGVRSIALIQEALSTEV